MRSSALWCLLLLAAFVVQESFARTLVEDVQNEKVVLEPDRSTSRKLSSGDNAWCRGWMTNVESNNVRGFKIVPSICYQTIKKYMENGQYLVDLSVSTSELLTYMSSIKPDGLSDAIMFDIDETLISTTPIQSSDVLKYGTVPFNSTFYNSQQDLLTLPSLPPSLDMYKELQAAGWKMILITGRKEISRTPTVNNLKAVGYDSWDELILKTDEYTGLTAAVYKSMARVKLEKEKGYTFKSCVGDQYSDCEGDATGERLWKFPNPMYYVA